mgnify:CR=1 FL=1
MSKSDDLRWVASPKGLLQMLAVLGALVLSACGGGGGGGGTGCVVGCNGLDPGALPPSPPPDPGQVSATGPVTTGLQAKALAVQEQIIDGLDGVTDSLSPSAKSGLLFAMNAVLGTNYDKERLETGQSTSNHSVMTTMLGNSVKGLYAKTPTTETRALPRTSRKRPAKHTPEIG